MWRPQRRGWPGRAVRMRHCWHRRGRQWQVRPAALRSVSSCPLRSPAGPAPHPLMQWQRPALQYGSPGLAEQVLPAGIVHRPLEDAEAPARLPACLLPPLDGRRRRHCQGASQGAREADAARAQEGEEALLGPQGGEVVSGRLAEGCADGHSPGLPAAGQPWHGGRWGACTLLLLRGNLEKPLWDALATAAGSCSPCMTNMRRLGS